MEEALSAAHKAWLDINLTKLQSTLDSQGLEIVENQKEGLQSRKKLAEQTREFKKLSDDEKLRDFKNILKAYQGEVDNITKRTKIAETAFLDLYKLLAEAPDPAPLIESYAHQAQRLGETRSIEQENKHLKAELAEAHAQVASARNAEGSVATLKSRLSKYEAKLEEMVNEKVAQKEAEMKETMDEKIRIYKETEHSLQRQLNQVKDQLVQLQSSHDVTQAKLVDHNQQYDEEVASKLGELEIVLMDLDRANLKIAHLEGENEVLRKEMTTSHGKNVEREWQDPSVLLERAQRLEADVTRLMAETDGLKDQLRDKGAAYAKRVSEVERDLALKNLNVAELETKLTEYEDYEKIKDELNVFKSIELDWVPDAKTNDHPLERLLLDKNKRLQAEVTSLKVDYTTISDELSATRRERDDLQNRCTQQQDLIGKLEDDLSKVNNIRETGKEAVQRPGLDPLSALVADAKLSPYDASTAARGTPVTPYTAGGSDAGAGEGNASIVPILTSQRDRYRQKNLELEQQIRNHLATISELRNDIEKLKSDNVTLYEKLRYTQSFQDGTAAAARRNEGSWRGDRSRDSGDHHVNIPLTYDQKRFTQDEVTAKYQTAYEGRLDPFRQFHKQEEARRLRNMNPAERATLNLTRLLAGNKYTRWFFVVYSLMLHMLVFATLYKLSQWEECRHDHENLLKPRDFVNGTGI